MKSKGMMDGVAGFVTQESKAFGLGASLDLENLGTLESLEPRMCEVEGDRDTGDTVR